MCIERREAVVNIILSNRVCTSIELKKNFLKMGLGEWAIRSYLNFLSARKCKLINVMFYQNSQKMIQFRKHGRIFYSKQVHEEELLGKILQLLTTLQRNILEKFSNYNKRIYYFSSYDLRKILPYASVSVEYSLRKLYQLKLLTKKNIEETTFYTIPKKRDLLKIERDNIFIDDKTEFTVIKTVHELILNLYPLNLIRNPSGAIRPSNKETLGITGGMTFDIFYRLAKPIGEKQFLAIDVYTRLPVNGYVVNSFLKKIEWSNSLKDKTYGMIVYRNATPQAIYKANYNNLRFVRLSDLKIDYKDIREKITLDAI
jgi:hypothetical protein